MLASHDQVREANERSDFRTEPRVKDAIQRAAALSGVDDSVFTTNAAHERTVLRPVDHATLFAALNTPPAPTSKLQAAFKRHAETIDSR